MPFLPPTHQRNMEFFNSALGQLTGLPPDKVRMIDRLEPKARTLPMRVLCFGMSRTGTFSLHTALTRLGYRPYHMAEVMMNPPVSMAAWGEALSVKYRGEGKPWTKEDFDKLLGDCDCIEDVPSICFAEELIKFYPDAKIILTQRPVNDWLRSMRATVLPSYTWPRWRYVSWADPDIAAPFHAFTQAWWPIIFGDLADTSGDAAPDPMSTHPHSPAAKYLAHYAHVRAVCPPERLLEFKLGDGYDKLCEFLGVEDVPEEAYPNINDGAFFIKMHVLMLDRATWMAVQKVAAVAVPVAAAVGAAVFYGARFRS